MRVVVRELNDTTAQSGSAARPALLEKLVLQIAQVCNLGCRYCITQQGEWGKTAQLQYMSPDTARFTINRFAEAFDAIAVINLFGGEPTLNLPVIEAVGQATDRLMEKGFQKPRPHISMSTNGMCASEEFIEIINRYRIRFAVSLDGPEEVNDINRVTKSGTGSYCRVRDNVLKLRSATGYPRGIAITYTAAHLDSPLTLWEMVSRLRDDLGIWDFAIMPATNSPATPGQWDPLLHNADRFIGEYQECIRRSLHEMASRDDAISIEYGKKALAKLVEEPSYERCPAGDAYFAVSSEGDVYPCQNLPESHDFRITNVRSEGFHRELWSSRIRKEIEDANRQAITTIDADENRSMCRICPSDNLGETGCLKTYSPQRFRLYKAINRVTKETLIDIISSHDEGPRNKLLENLDRGDSSGCRQSD